MAEIAKPISTDLSYDEAVIKFTDYFCVEEDSIYSTLRDTNSINKFSKYVSRFVYLDEEVLRLDENIETLKEQIKESISDVIKDKFKRKIHAYQLELEQNEAELSKIEMKLREFCQEYGILLDNDYSHLNDKYGIELTDYVEQFSPYVKVLEKDIYDKISHILDSVKNINIRVLINDGLQAIKTHNNYIHLIVFTSTYKLMQRSEARELIFDVQPKYTPQFEQFCLEKGILTEEDIRTLYYS